VRKGWRTVKLSEVCEILRGGSPRPISDYITEDEDGINWIKIGDVAEGAKYLFTTKEKIRPEGAKHSRQVKSGDFLLSNSMSFGRPYILRTTGCIHDGWLVLRDKDNQLNEDYLYHVLSSDFVYAQFKKFAVGAVVKNLNIEVVENVEIPLPHITDQKRIAAILDQADALRIKRKESLVQLDNLAHSIFIEMFGEPIANPKQWTTQPLSALVTGKPNNGIFKKNDEYGEGLPVVWVGELFKDNGINCSNSQRLVPNKKELEQYGLHYGDILFCRSSLKLAGIGYNNVYLGESNKALFECHVIRITPDKNKIAPVFLNFALRMPSQRLKLFKHAKTVTMTTIDQDGLLRVDLPVPPLHLQKQFEERLDAIERLKAVYAKSQIELDTLFDSLQFRAFRGEL
jgi:type I restriction enzyme S subunit